MSRFWALFTVLVPLLILGCTRIPEADFTASVTSGPAPLIVQFTDASKNSPDTWSWDLGDGAASTEQNPSHQYTKAGTFTVSLTASNKAGSKTTTKTGLLTVEPGALARLDLSPRDAGLAIGASQAFSAVSYDQFDNLISELRVSFRADPESGTVDDQGNFKAGTKAGTYDTAVTAQVSQNGLTKSVTAKVTIKPDPLDRVEVTPGEVTLNIGKTQQYQAQALDKYGNLLKDVTIKWKAQEAKGAITADGLFTAGTVAGTFPEGVLAEGTQGTISKATAVPVSIRPDPLDKVLIQPTDITLEVGTTTQLSFKVLDKYGNGVVHTDARWSANPEAGSIASTGEFKAGTRAGEFVDAIKVQVTDGRLIAEGVARVRLIPGSLAKAIIEPASIVLDIGVTQTFTVRPMDEFENSITVFDAHWSAGSGVGTIDGKGSFTSGTKAGAYPKAILVEVVTGAARATATADLKIRPDPLATIQANLSSVVVLPGQDIEFTAKGFDKYSNPIPDLSLRWETQGDGITTDGRLTAPKLCGVYTTTVSGEYRQARAAASIQVTVGAPITGRALWNNQPLAQLEVRLLPPGQGYNTEPVSVTKTDARGEFALPAPIGAAYTAWVVTPSKEFAALAQGRPVSPVTSCQSRDLGHFDLAKAIETLTPHDREIVSTRTPLLSWTPMPEAFDYYISLYVAPSAGSGPVLTSGWIREQTGVLTTQYRFAIPLTPGKDYCWMVSARNLLQDIIGESNASYSCFTVAANAT